MVESIENVNEYHRVFAQSIATVMNSYINKDKETAKNLMKFVISYVYVQYQDMINADKPIEVIYKEIEELKLDSRSLDELSILMSYYQAKAKMKAAQSSDGKAPIWQRLKNRL